MIYVVIGTKAQLVKMAPVMLSFDRHGLDYQFILTGQHAETMDDLINDFSLKRPDWYFVEPKEADTHSRLLVWLMKAFINGIRRLPRGNKNDLVLVHGDTLSTLLAAIIGRLKRMTVVHVEAGLRSHNYFHPFPEELVRVMVSRVSDYFICQDEKAAANLQSVGIDESRVVNVQANTLIDSLRYADNLETLGANIPEQPYCVVSLHRSENLSNQKRFDFLMSYVGEIGRSVSVQFVMHPVTRKRLLSTGWYAKLEANPAINLIERLPYTLFMKLLRKASFLVTDGGSNQEEASYIGLPCLLLRQATERHEGLGENVTLSQYDLSTMRQFVSENANSVTEPTPKVIQDYSPSDEIALFVQRLN